MKNRIAFPAALLALSLVGVAHAQNPWTSRTEADEMQKSSSTVTRASVIADMHRYQQAGGSLERNSSDEIQVASGDKSRSAVKADTAQYVAAGNSLERHSEDELQKSGTGIVR